MLATRKKKNDFVINRILGKKVTLFQPRLLRGGNKGFEIMSVTIDEYYTRIDFKYTASSKYINGGWVMIHKETYIQIAGTGIKYSLIKTANIPIAPMRHHFQNCDELLFYTLYFPPIPCEVQIIDVMESSEAESPFNFHKVFLEKGKRKYDFDFSEN